MLLTVKYCFRFIVGAKLGIAGEYAITKAQEASFMMDELEELHDDALTKFEKEEWSKKTC